VVPDAITLAFLEAANDRMSSLAAGCTILAIAAAAEPDYRIEVTPARRIEAQLTMKIDTPAIQAREWILFAARPPELLGQRDLHTVLSPSGRAATELSPEERPILWSRVPTRGRQWMGGITARVRYRATLFSRRLTTQPARGPVQPAESLAPRQRRFALGASASIDVDSPDLLQWIDAHRLRRGEGEGEVDFARRVHVAIARAFSYELREDMDRRASNVCREGKSDCAGLSALFAAVLRAGDVPARLLVGRSVIEVTDPRVPAAMRARRPHVRTEFFAEGVGWVPVDLSREIFTPSRRRTVYFGYDPGDMLVVHVGDDLVLNTIHSGRQTVESLQGVRFWVVGEGTSDGMSMEEEWETRRVGEEG
jgi:hypothetical protein